MITRQDGTSWVSAACGGESVQARHLDVEQRDVWTRRECRANHLSWYDSFGGDIRQENSQGAASIG